jgi:hypothetical protein
MLEDNVPRKDFVYTYKPNAMWLEGAIIDEWEARVYFWNNEQHRLLNELQNEIDLGWIPITAVGPAAFKVRLKKRTKRSIGFIDVLGWFLTFGLWLVAQLLTGFKDYNIYRYEAVEFRVGLSKPL